ncbi:hypothetical protein Q8A73_001733 [Channa argus]|nr:hypothetical protein Q8A73_001733 [Channa argus]
MDSLLPTGAGCTGRDTSVCCAVNHTPMPYSPACCAPTVPLRTSMFTFPALTVVFTAHHHRSATEMNRPWLAAITVHAKYLPAPLEETRPEESQLRKKLHADSSMWKCVHVHS